MSSSSGGPAFCLDHILSRFEQFDTSLSPPPSPPPFSLFIPGGNVFLSLLLVVLLHCLPLSVLPTGPTCLLFYFPFVPLFSPIFPLPCRLLTGVCSRTKDPQAKVKAHIKLLHDYNEIRDVGQGLMGIIADNRGVRARDVYQEFDVDEGD